MDYAIRFYSLWVVTTLQIIKAIDKIVHLFTIYMLNKND